MSSFTPAAREKFENSMRTTEMGGESPFFHGVPRLLISFQKEICPRQRDAARWGEGVSHFIAAFHPGEERLVHVCPRQHRVSSLSRHRNVIKMNVSMAATVRLPWPRGHGKDKQKGGPGRASKVATDWGCCFEHASLICEIMCSWNHRECMWDYMYVGVNSPELKNGRKSPNKIRTVWPSNSVGKV